MVISENFIFTANWPTQPRLVKLRTYLYRTSLPYFSHASNPEVKKLDGQEMAELRYGRGKALDLSFTWHGSVRSSSLSN